jgi:hypothetical protein
MGGHGGHGGSITVVAGGLVSLSGSSIIGASGRDGGTGGAGTIAYGGAAGGNGGNGGQISIEGSSIAMTAGSIVRANGGSGGWGGNGFATYGGDAVFTVTDGQSPPVEICGGSSGFLCDGTQLVDSEGIPLAFVAVDGSGAATVGGSGGNGGSVYGGGPAIWMNATAGNISMSGDSSVYASPGGGGQAGLGWEDGAIGYYYPTYPSSFVQQILWTGVFPDYDDWSRRGDSGTAGTVSLNATGSVSLGTVNADPWGGTVNVTAGGAIIDNNGSGAVNISAQHATLTSTYGGTAGSLAISAGTEVSGNLVATVSGGAYGGIDIANRWDQQPVSVNLTDNATNGSAVFRQVFTSPTGTLSSSSISLSAQPGGFVGLSSNRDLTFNGGTFTAGGGGIVAFAANSGILNINNALAGDTDSVELSAGTLNISAPVSGANISLDGSTINVGAATTATGDLVAGGGTVNINAAVSAQDIILGANTLNITSGGGLLATRQSNSHLLATVTGDVNITGGYIRTTNGTGEPGYGDLQMIVGGNLNVGNASYGGSIYAGFGQTLSQPSPYYYADASIAVGGNLKLTNGAYIAAANDIYLDMLGFGSTIELSSGGGLPAYILSDVTGPPTTIYIDFLTRSDGGVFIDGVATTTSLPGGSGFFVTNQSTPATTAAGGGLEITYAGATSIVFDPCASSPGLCKPPLPDLDVMDNGADPCASAPDSAQCKALKDEKQKAEKDEFGDEDGKQNEKSSQKKVAQCSV